MTQASEQGKALLVVSMRELLDKSAEGRQGAAALAAALAEKKKAHGTLADAAEARRFEAEAVAALETERARLRDRLIARARVVVEEVRRERGAAAVLDRELAIAWDDALDVTAEVLARLDR